MNAKVSIVCYKQKTLKNGEHPIMIRVTKNGKRKYKSLGNMENKELIEDKYGEFLMYGLSTGNDWEKRGKEGKN
jgi:hypothetical protein